MLVHKTIASGVLASNTDGEDLAHYRLYTAPTASGTHVKSFIFHNLSGNSYDVPARLYINVADATEVNGLSVGGNLSSENRIMYLNLPDYETVEWDIGYQLHLNSGEALYGESDYPNHVNYYINGAEDEGCNEACP